MFMESFSDNNKAGFNWKVFSIDRKSISMSCELEIKVILLTGQVLSRFRPAQLVMPETVQIVLMLTNVRTTNTAVIPMPTASIATEVSLVHARTDS